MEPRVLAPFVLALVGFLPLPSRAAYEVTGSPTGTLKIEQTADDGKLSIRVTQTSYVVSDGTGFQAFSEPPNSIRIKMLPGDGDLDVDLDWILAGNLDLRLGASGAVAFIGDVNQIRGRLKIRSGDGGHLVSFEGAQHLQVGGNVTLNLGRGYDTVSDAGVGFIAEDDLLLKGVDRLAVSEMLWVLENATWKVLPGEAGELDATGYASFMNLRFKGADGRDQLVFGGGGGVPYRFVVNLKGAPDGPPQLVDLRDAGAGTLKMTAARSSAGVTLLTDADSIFEDQILLKLPGPGPNSVDLMGYFFARTLRYVGGSGVDDLEVRLVQDFSDPRGSLKAKLGAGDDHVTIQDETELVSAKIDFGPGADTFDPPAAPAYPITTKNLP